jgi:hypothetical protein
MGPPSSLSRTVQGVPPLLRRHLDTVLRRTQRTTVTEVPVTRKVLTKPLRGACRKKSGAMAQHQLRYRPSSLAHRVEATTATTAAAAVAVDEACPMKILPGNCKLK